MHSNFELGTMNPIHQQTRPDLVRTLIVLLVILIACADVAIERVNLATVFTIPLVLVGLLSRHNLWKWLAILVALTFADYALKWRFSAAADDIPFVSYRLFNRALVAGSLVLVASILARWNTWQASLMDAEGSNPNFRTDDDNHFHELFSDMEVAVGTGNFVLGGLAIVVIACLDMLTPPQFNWSILYVVPLVLCAWTKNRLLLWGILSVLCVLCAAGFILGVSDEFAVEDRWIHTVYSNRYLAVVALLCLAVVLNAWMQIPGAGRWEPGDERLNRPA